LASRRRDNVAAPTFYGLVELRGVSGRLRGFLANTRYASIVRVSLVMSGVNLPSLKERLWHAMRSDLAKFAPEISNNQLLMCCCCCRLLPQENFDVEHLVPRQALRVDPVEVRENPATPLNVRAGTLLLCKKPLMFRNSRVYQNGCNSWKGRFYDRPISDLFSGKTAPSPRTRVHTNHIIGSLMLGYLAMVSEFGYVVALAESGQLLREQFFHPNKILNCLGTRYQMVLVGQPSTDPADQVWSKPFSYAFDRGACIVTARNFAITVPVSRDPRIPNAQHVKFAPSKYKFRPILETGFH
jgi:hypothetical protein